MSVISFFTFSVFAYIFRFTASIDGWVPLGDSVTPRYTQRGKEYLSWKLNPVAEPTTKPHHFRVRCPPSHRMFVGLSLHVCCVFVQDIENVFATSI